MRASRESSKANSKELKGKVQIRFAYSILSTVKGKEEERARENREGARIDGKNRDRLRKTIESMAMPP